MGVCLERVEGKRPGAEGPRRVECLPVDGVSLKPSLQGLLQIRSFALGRGEARRGRRAVGQQGPQICHRTDQASLPVGERNASDSQGSTDVLKGRSQIRLGTKEPPPLSFQPFQAPRASGGEQEGVRAGVSRRRGLPGSLEGLQEHVGIGAPDAERAHAGLERRLGSPTHPGGQTLSQPKRGTFEGEGGVGLF